MSSVLIRGMKMPTSCGKCRFCVNGFTDNAPMYECAVQSYDNVSVPVDYSGKPFNFRPDWCPLVGLPPHGRLIDADKIDFRNDAMHDGTGNLVVADNFINGILWLNGCIDRTPTVIEAEGSET